MGQDREHSAINRQALSIALAVAPFGLAFGVVSSEAGLSVVEAVGFSTLVFSGSAQFAAVSVLSDGGSAIAAVTAGLLLNLRSLAFGVAMASALQGPLWWRALVSQLMIDESTAVGSVQRTDTLKRYGYLTAGLAVFFFWNLSTLLGVSLLGSSEELIFHLGIDATIPAAFLALLWPRLHIREQREVALGGAIIALVLVPITPVGVPIIASAAAVCLARPWQAPEVPNP
ncbi:MAG: AzlC family ABC transporter permease [Acidimicrobiales bacterium]